MFGANRAAILHRHWLPTDRNEIPLDPRHLGVPSGASKMISEPMVCLAQTMHLSCTNTNTISKWTDQDFTRPTSPRSFPSGASKMIFEPMVRLAQTVHRSCIKISTISKRIKMSFQLSFVTYEYHQVRPKQYLSLWYVWRKPCTYLALTLTASPNRPNEIPHDPRHLRLPMGVSRMIYEPMVRSAQTMH